MLKNLLILAVSIETLQISRHQSIMDFEKDGSKAAPHDKTSRLSETLFEGQLVNTLTAENRETATATALPNTASNNIAHSLASVLQAKFAVSDARQALLDIKNAALDTSYINSQRKRPIDIQEGHALMMRWDKYRNRSPRVSLFGPDGKILLSLRIQRLAVHLRRQCSDIKLSTKFEEKNIRNSRLLEDDIEGFQGG